MESTTRLDKTSTFIPEDKVHVIHLLDALNYYANTIEVLSLDCFDTLLWRKTAAPIDVFYEMHKKPMFQFIKLNPSLRMRIESLARNLKFVQDGNTEVTLHDIYRYGYPNLSLEQLDTLAEEELATEIEFCYAFAPILQLMRAAKSHGIKIIIVSNTYFKKEQLRRLLAAHLPADIMSTINEIYCSCEYGASKNLGLFKHVLEKYDKPESILHIGDDLQADLLATQALGLKSLQLIHHDHNVTEFLRLHATSAAIFNPDIRHTQPLVSPFHGIFANTIIDSPEKLIGYASIGPIMYAFAEFINHEIAQIRRIVKNPKVLFLMRDAYLPSVICEILNQQPIGTNICISRFAAYAATFRSMEDIEKYIAEVITSGRFNDIARQLLLPNEIIEPLIQLVNSSSNPTKEFICQIKRNEMQYIIFQNSLHYRKRLIQYLKKEINLTKGDTLLFIDLGYSGTAQYKLTPILQEELNVESLGRYLIQLNIPEWEKSRRGLIDPSWCDERAMAALIHYISLLEQICTSNENSVIDYDEQGNPIFSETSFNKNQYIKVDKIQKECIQFVKDAKNFFAGNKLPIKTLQQNTLAELGRLIFFPTESEVNYLESFQFDLNLGTTDLLRVFNSKEGLRSLRKRGLFFTFMEKNKKTFRTNYPAELRTAGMELSITLLTQARFSLDFGFRDMSLRRELISVMVTENGKITQTTIEALLTYDGYYSLTLPIGKQGFHINLIFGQNYQWIQIEEAELILKNTFLKSTESLNTEDYTSSLIFNEMTHHDGNLYHCHSISSSLVIAPIQKLDGKDYLVRLTFRPIVHRDVIN